MKRILLILVLILLQVEVTSAQETEVEWWKDYSITASGYGTVVDGKVETAEIQKQKAIANARKKIIEQVTKINITADKTISAEMLEGIEELGIVKDETVYKNGSCKVKMILPLFGEKNSLSKIIFKPVPKKNFPEPKNSSGNVEGEYTGLVIDCTDWEILNSLLQPVLLPTVKGEDGTIVYDYSFADYDSVVKGGMVDYVADKKSSNRAGEKPLIIKIQSLEDKNSTPILSAEDVDKILRENKSTHFLERCAVVIVTEKAIVDEDERGGNSWGVRDSDIFA